MKNKKLIITLSIIAILVLTIGITYAIFTSSRTSKNSNLVVGDIYMHYNETNQIQMENAMPSDTYDQTKYFEFTIDGKNTTTDKTIWYEIILNHGDDETDKTRIKDNLLKFTLTETKDGTTSIIFNGRSYDDLTSKRIWVDTINKNTTSEVVHTYRLYMWISNNTVIGNVNQDYTMEEWKNVFASIKVNVAGDFEEKVLTTDESCFTVGTINDGNEVAIIDYVGSCGSDVVIPSTIKGYPVTVIGNTSTSYIEKLSNKNNDYKLNDLNNYQKNVNIKPTVGWEANGSFQDRNLTSVVIPNSVTTIDSYAFLNNRLTNVTISDSVTTIDSYAFFNNRLTNVTIPDSVTTIGWRAFINNYITSVTIPDSVTYLDCDAFDDTVSIIKSDSLVCQSKR